MAEHENVNLVGREDGELEMTEHPSPQGPRGLSGWSLAPRSLSEAKHYAKMIAGSDMVPQAYRNKPANVLVAVQMGAEVGLKPLQALQHIAVINGKPSLYGDGLIALCLQHPDCEDIRETFDAATNTASCQVKRRGHQWYETTFSEADAKSAGLWGKSGPWKQYPKRMLALRARGFALRNKFADALAGMGVAEELSDIPVHEARIETPAPPPQSRTAALSARLQSNELSTEVSEADEVALHEPIEGEVVPDQATEPAPAVTGDQDGEVSEELHAVLIELKMASVPDDLKRCSELVNSLEDPAEKRQAGKALAETAMRVASND